MKSHYETYKGWDISVQISAHLSAIDVDSKQEAYMPRIVVTEHLENRNFRDVEVIDGHSYPSRETCINQGIAAARAYIDRKTAHVAQKVLHGH